MKSLTLDCLIFLVAADCSTSPTTDASLDVPSQTTVTSVYWATDGWRSSTPEEQGMDISISGMASGMGSKLSPPIG